jgi:hypothetical protein
MWRQRSSLALIQRIQRLSAISAIRTVGRKDGERYGEYRTKRMVVEAYEEAESLRGMKRMKAE